MYDLPNHHLPPADVPPLSPTSRSATLAAYYRAGWLIADLMAATGLSYRKIRAALRAANVALREPRQSVDLRTEAQQHSPPGAPRQPHTQAHT